MAAAAALAARIWRTAEDASWSQSHLINITDVPIAVHLALSSITKLLEHVQVNRRMLRIVIISMLSLGESTPIYAWHLGHIKYVHKCTCQKHAHAHWQHSKTLELEIVFPIRVLRVDASASSGTRNLHSSCASCVGQITKRRMCTHIASWRHDTPHITI